MDVQVASSGQTITTKALIDTGSPRTVFPRLVADLVGLSLPEYPSRASKKITLMGRVWPAVTETVGLLLMPFEDLGWDAEVDFVIEDGLPFALLGYEGFLNRWAVSFNGYQGYFLVEKADDFAERQPEGLLEDL